MARLPQSRFLAGSLHALLAWWLSGAAALAQATPEWRQFTTRDGLADSYVSAVSVSPRGDVIFTHKTPGAVTVYDGYEFRGVKPRDSAKGGKAGFDQPYRVLEDFSGSLWTVCQEGLAEWKEGAWVDHQIPEITREIQTKFYRLIRANWVQPLGLGRVLFLTENRLMGYDVNKSETRTWKLAAQTRLGSFSDLTAARGGGLWINGGSGVAKIQGPLDLLKPGAAWEEFIPDPQQQIHNFQRAFPNDQGGLVMLAEQGPSNRRVIVLFDGKSQWSVIDPPTGSVRLAWPGLDGSIWAASVNALYRRENGQWSPAPVSKEEPQYLDVLVEPNGAFWLATSEGSFRYTPAPWRRPPGASRDENPALAFFEDSDSRLWNLQPNGLRIADANGWTKFSTAVAPPAALSPADAYPLANGLILAGWNEKIFKFDRKKQQYTELGDGDGRKRKLLGRLDGGRICLRTMPGEPGRRPWKFECSDGVSLAPCRELPEDLSVGADVRFVSLARNMDIWVGGSSFVALGRGGRWHVFTEPEENAPQDPQGFLELGEGKVWICSRRQIFEFDGKNWSFIRGAFTGINGMTRSTDGRIWVATDSGLYRYFKGDWASVSIEEGLPSQEVLSVFEDSLGRVWAGTRRGAAIYHPEADPDPPRTRIVAVSTDNRESTEVVFMGRDKWNATLPENLLFSYRRDTEEWQPFTSLRQFPSVSYQGLDAGRHVFQVRAMDRNWNVERFVSREFLVTLPWYVDFRLISISAGAILAALFFAILALNRHMRLVRSYAEVERIVALRTSQLEKANLELLHSQKMNALGAMAAGVAHDFNNILSIIKGSAQLIEANIGDPAKIRTRAGRIKTVVDQGATIVQAMLGFSRGSGRELAHCDLNTIVEETTRLLGDHALDQVKIEFDWAPALPPTLGLKDYIQQILLNFIFNAADAMNGKGRIILRVGELNALPPDLALAPEPAGHYLYISVKDFGSGINPAIQSRIFEPFFTTKAFSTRRGTGLGLSMAYEMARSMGCGLRVESELGQGSSFTLILPLRQSSPTPDKEGGQKIGA